MPFTLPITNPWSCLPAAFSMACGVPFKTIIDLIGHDGSELPYTNTQFRAGFHPQECLEAAEKLGWWVTPIELHPSITPDGSEERQILFQEGNWARYLRHLTGCHNGVIEGMSLKSGLGHAVAWDGYHIYDTKLMQAYSFAEHLQRGFKPEILWKLVRNGGIHEV